MLRRFVAGASCRSIVAGCTSLVPLVRVKRVAGFHPERNPARERPQPNITVASNLQRSAAGGPRMAKRTHG